MSGVLGAPKADVSLLYNAGDFQVGAEAAVSAKGEIGAYALAAQTMDDVVAAVILADKLDTVKASAVLKLDGATSAAAEATYKIKSGDLKLAAAAPPRSWTAGTPRAWC